MSAWLFTKAQIHGVIDALKYVKANANGAVSLSELPDDWNKAGVALYNLNYKAVVGRYPAYAHEYGPPAKRFSYRPGNQPVIQLYKTLGCFAYQCSEDANSGSALLEQLNAAEKWLAAHVGHNPKLYGKPGEWKNAADAKAYEAAEWG